ncbi:MAG TPA: hypothetical protein VHS81_03065 [Caulobacteraceae bacterium]|nr:hypothetical protein [Caulobacteraceae bacterium]
MRALVPLLLGASMIMTSAQAQGPDGQFHDCYRVTRATIAIDADADGVAMRLGANADRFYPGRAQRMDKSARVFLRCHALTDRPLGCVVVSETLPGFDFGPAAVRIAQSGRLTAPAGIWPLDVVVAFHTTQLARPIFAGYC